MAGPAGIQTPLIIRFTQSVAGAGNNDYTVTRAGRVMDAWGTSTSGVGGETAGLTRNRGGVLQTITTAAPLNLGGGANVVGRATILDSAGYDLVAGDALRFVTAGALCMAEVFVLYLAPVAHPVTLTD